MHMHAVHMSKQPPTAGTCAIPCLLTACGDPSLGTVTACAPCCDCGCGCDSDCTGAALQTWSGAARATLH
jgi:hypothetical protein